MIYVNEIDPYCAEWLQNLMDAEVLPRGHIDTRSIEDVTPNDLAGYSQHHFFAGLGGWIYALDLAGWPRDRPVWTGSCPCQPFSSAGKGAGFADERHLWPAWLKLIATCKPAIILGEQVASKSASLWVDQVQFDLENIRFWEEYEKEVHSLRGVKDQRELSKILWEVARRAETSMQDMPKGIRGGLAFEKQKEVGGCQIKSKGQRCGLPKEIHSGESGTLPLLQDKSAMPEEGACFRFGRIREGAEQEDSCGSVRDDRVADSAECRTDEVEQCLSGQNRTQSWLHILQYSRGLLRDERMLGELGRRSFQDDCGILLEGVGIDDERRIAEAFRGIIASSLIWKRVDLVHVDMEGMGYAFGSVPFPAAGVGAPHIRDRNYWAAERVAHAAGAGRGQAGRHAAGHREAGEGRQGDWLGDAGTHDQFPRVAGELVWLADSADQRQHGRRPSQAGNGRNKTREQLERLCDAGWLADATGAGSPHRGAGFAQSESAAFGRSGSTSRPGQTNGFWRYADWLGCRDGKWRPVEPGTFPLAHGVPGRVGRLRAYGNAIVPAQAAEFVAAFMSTHGVQRELNAV